MSNFFYKIADWYFTKNALPFWVVLIIDCFIVLVSGLACYTLGHGATATALTFIPLVGTLLIYLVPFLIGFRVTKTYASVMRYSSFADLFKVAGANFIGIFIIALMRIHLKADSLFVPIRMRDLLFTFVVATAAMIMVRVLVKYLYEKAKETDDQIRVFIYGTKQGGIALAKSLRSQESSEFRLMGFVSDSNDLPGHSLLGVNVYPNDDKLISRMKKDGVQALFISPLKSYIFANNTEMSQRLIDANIHVYTMGATRQWDGKSDIRASQLRPVQIEDLLPRDEIEVDLQAVERLLKGKTILVTGSAGSIGSEIVNQIAQFAPKQLVLIDEAETPQHDIRLLMAKNYPDVKADVIVTSITKILRMESIFSQYRPDYVFHAAAYKHVPMMEDNPSEAVQNNIDGTRIMADLSVKYGVKKFVMVSTDKAVNPTNVMGCSKRICEIYVQSLDKAIKEKKIQGNTQFVTTRFGNVLGSNGSVIPLFKEQIRNGGPVTVTHPDIIRFFMLIPEACKLVLEAGTMGNGGEIYVFDMGKPVKIADLARRMIQLSGAHNVEIKFTGLRDGEKLYEEVLNDEEVTLPTNNKKIKVAQVREYDFDEASRLIDQLIEQSKRYDDMETVRLMKEIVPEYKSQHSRYEVLDKS